MIIFNKSDGTTESHTGNLAEIDRYKFITNNEMVADDPNSKEKRSLNSILLTATSCTMVIYQQKAKGSVEMIMYLKKK